jgi:adenylate kinase family enzyme
LAWLPGWQATTEEYQRGVIEAICAADEWILDTAYGQWIDLALERVELIVALDYPRWISFLRLFKRTASRIADKKPVCNGNYETLRNTLSRDSILLWHFRSFNRKRRRIRQWANAPSGPTVIVLRSPRTAAEWLASTQDKRGDVVFGNIAEQKLKSGPKF